jgi:hypothetical protein
MQSSRSTPIASSTPERPTKHAWERPALIKLPPLTELTLQTGPGIPGSGDPPGSGTVF